MHYEGPRRQGRFLKQGSKVLEKISLMDFSFEEISDTKALDLDNAQRSIVHSQFHHEAELAETVKTPERFNDDLVSPEQKRSVILPMDFTKEWQRDHKMRKDRVTRLEDDEFDFEYEAAVRFQEHQHGKHPPVRAAVAAAPAAEESAKGPAPVVAEAPKSTAGAPIPAAGAKPVVAPIGAEKPIPAPKAVVGETPKYESMDVVGKAIKNLLHTSEEEGGASDFIPVTPLPATAGPQDPEAEASAAYRQRVEQQQINQKQLDEMVAEAKANGYRDGFGAGEEKAEIQVRQNAAAVFGKVTELMQEFGKLKHEILDNVQQNFYELCQAMAESLIKREFSIHPEAFVTVLRRAISEAVEPGKFKIRVHPDFFDKIMALGDQDIKEALVKDSEIERGDFKIESNLSVVDVNVGKMIGELLTQADLQLFDDEEKAS